MLDLKPGVLKIPVEFEGEINYISPESGDDVALSADKIDTLSVVMRQKRSGCRMEDYGNR
ncbi:hypothetical protein NXW94_27070 [Bacteroides ovatus]|nr:hypothetical protein [Bacteroides ovatus]